MRLHPQWEMNNFRKVIKHPCRNNFEEIRKQGIFAQWFNACPSNCN